MKVLSRYEYWSSKGKVFTDWFKIAEFESLEEAQQYVKNMKDTLEYIDKKTKLIHEYTIE